MKKMLLMVLSLILTPSLYADSIEGTWQGQLIVSPGNELTIQFIIESAEGGYSVTLNSPESGAIKNVPADTARFENGELTLEVAELSGSFAGNFNEGEISGHWQQLDQLLPLVLKPLLKAELSETFRSLLSGRWEGSIKLPGGDEILIDMIFKIDEENNVTGDLGIPEQTPSRFPMSDVIASESGIRLNITVMNASFKGSFTKDGLIGEWTQGSSLPLTLVKKVFDPKLLALDLGDEARSLLMGSWFGYINTPAGDDTIVYRFVQVDDYIHGYADKPDHGSYNTPIKSVTLNGSEIEIKVHDYYVFTGKVEDGKLAGELKDLNQTMPLMLEKGRLPPIALDIPEPLRGIWQGVQKSPKGSNTVIVRFEQEPAGVMVGFVDQPDLHIKGSRIHDVTVSADEVTIKLSELTRTSFTGTLSGDQLIGAVTTGAKVSELELKRMK